MAVIHSGDLDRRSRILASWPGWAALGIVYLMLTPVYPMLRTLSKLRARINAETDNRVSIVNDLITGIRLLKAYAWEDVYFEFLREVRHREIKLNKSKTRVASGLQSVAGYAGRAPALVAVALYSLNHPLNLDQSANVLCLVFCSISFHGSQPSSQQLLSRW